jgi:exonuclease VII large subunit
MPKYNFACATKENGFRAYCFESHEDKNPQMISGASYEELKTKLAKEGLWESAKKPTCFYPIDTATK